MRNLIFLLFFYSINFYSQIKNVECTYTVYTTADLDSTLTKSNLIQTLLKTKPLIYNLTIKNNLTYYYENPAMISEKVDEQSLRIRRIISGGINTINTNLTSGVIKEEFENGGGFFCIKTNFLDYKWVLSKETKNIDKYECFKATLIVENINREGEIVTSEVIAYFTPTIPLNSGPLSYSGLPGLILEIQEKSKIIRIHSISFKEFNENYKEKSQKCDYIFNSKLEYEKFIFTNRKSK